ncbi:MAG: hypothetical protein K2N54_05345 [Helicobacter sp.]|nr:hypothetical protein [Helicobacter sp.]
MQRQGKLEVIVAGILLQNHRKKWQMESAWKLKRFCLSVISAIAGAVPSNRASICHCER